MLRSTATRTASAATQDCVKAVYALQDSFGGPVSITALAAKLGCTPASATTMIKRLADGGLISRTPYRGVALTPAGESVALKVIRHHRLLETFLATELGMPWERVHAEAEVLEHVLSDELEALIAEKLGHPDRDPHGAPIPDAELRLPTTPEVALASLPVGAHGTFVRVLDGDPEMLRYLGARGVAPGDDFELLDREPFGGPLSVRIGSGVHALGGLLADAMRVVPAPAQATDDLVTLTSSGEDT